VGAVLSARRRSSAAERERERERQGDRVRGGEEE